MSFMTPSPACARCSRDADVEIAWVCATGESGLYRNAIGDELVFVQAGAGRLDSVRRISHYCY